MFREIWLGTALLLALSACAPADAASITPGDTCITQEEAASAVHDWDPNAVVLEVTSEQTKRYNVWHKAEHQYIHDGEIFALSVTWKDGVKGVIVGSVDSQGCIANESVDKLTLEVWDQIINGTPL